MKRPRLFFGLMFVVGMYCTGFAYDILCSPPFTISRPQCFSSFPNMLHFAEEKISFSFEIATGEYVFSHLFPWPRVQAYWRFGYMDLRGFVTLMDRYQYTIRNKMRFIDSYGEYVGIGYYWSSSFIYTLRGGLSYLPFSNIVIGLSGDVNFGLEKLDLEPSLGVEYLEYHTRNTGNSTSYSIGITIFSHNRQQMLSIGYNSRIVVAFNGLDYRYLIPHQICVSLRLPVSSVDIGLNYYRRFTKYEFYPGMLGTISHNDFTFDLLIPIGTNTKLFFSLYTLPLTYPALSKGFGISLGPKFVKKFFLKDLIAIYETGRHDEFDWNWRLTRYGIRMVFSI